MTRLANTGNLRQTAPRERDKAYLGYIAALGGPHGYGCIICRTQPCEVAHVRFAEVCIGALCLGRDGCNACGFTGYRFGKLPTGMGSKSDDKWCVPLCPDCHRFGKSAQHTMNERLHWEAKGIDVLKLCHELQEAYNSIEQGVAVLERAREAA